MKSFVHSTDSFIQDPRPAKWPSRSQGCSHEPGKTHSLPRASWDLDSSSSLLVFKKEMNFFSVAEKLERQPGESSGKHEWFPADQPCPAGLWLCRAPHLSLKSCNCCCPLLLLAVTWPCGKNPGHQHLQPLVHGLGTLQCLFLLL